MYRILFAALLAAAADGQTVLSLDSQSKNVDFTKAAFTRPVKTGTTLPSTCSVGDLFFQTNAVAGSNLYGCATANTWTVQSGGGSGGGSLAIDNNGTLVGSRGVMNLIGGVGVINTISDTGTQINVQQSVDTSVIPSKATAQSGAMFLCTAAGSSNAYTCAMSPTLQGYTTGMAAGVEAQRERSGRRHYFECGHAGSRQPEASRRRNRPDQRRHRRGPLIQRLARRHGVPADDARGQRRHRSHSAGVQCYATRAFLANAGWDGRERHGHGVR